MRKFIRLASAKANWHRVLPEILTFDIDYQERIAAIWSILRNNVKKYNNCVSLYDFSSTLISLGSDSVETESGEFGRRPSCPTPACASILVRGAAGGVLVNAGWVAYETYRAAQEVAEVRVNGRAIAISSHGYCIVTWRSQRNDGLLSRPTIRAIGRDGQLLTEFRKGEHVDSATLSFALQEGAPTRSRG